MLDLAYARPARQVIRRAVRQTSSHKECFMNYQPEIITQYIKRQEDVLEIYSEDLPKHLFQALAESIDIYLMLLDAILEIQLNSEIKDTRVDILDSLYFIQRGLELTNSYLLMLCHNHFPAPLFLLRSILNQFWFSYCCLVNHTPRKNGRRFYEEYESEHPYMSRFELKIDHFSRVVDLDETGRDLNIISRFNSILHGAFDSTDIWKKTNRDFFINPSPVKMDAEYATEHFTEALIHIRGALEFCRVVMVANYLLKEPAGIFNGLFDQDNMRPGSIDAYAHLLSQVVHNEDLDIGALQCHL
jgi:hypothetical protein